MHTITRSLLYGLLLTCAAAATPAFADTIDSFTVTDGATGNVYTFSVDSTPDASAAAIAESGYVNEGSYFEIDVPVSENGGTPSDSASAYLTFTGSGTGGIYLFASGVAGTGATLFTVTSSGPTFTPGTYNLQEVDPSTDVVKVVIAAESPEPNSLVLLGTGALGMLGAFRRKIGAALQ
jgi:hypothetical protein